ncbi:MAG: type II toxin-antitoxin system VapC family toxin [Acidobacteriaceae bacterium]
MKPAFWDSSALVPFCARQKASPNTYRLLGQYSVVVWWATPVEVRSALERLLRTQNLSAAEHAGAEKRLDRLRRGWGELAPTEAMRDQAEKLLARFPLSSADALQLAAAMAWAGGHPRGRVFICGDARLLAAAEQLGFRTIEA